MDIQRETINLPSSALIALHRVVRITMAFFLKNTSLKQTIVKNVFWLAASEAGSMLLLAISTVLIARNLGPDEYGKFSFVLAFVTIFSVSADLGLSTLAIREIARNPRNARTFIANLLSLKLLLGIFTFIIISSISQLIDKPVDIRVLINIAAFWAIFQSMTQVLQSIFRGFEKMEYETLSKFSYAVLILILTLYVILGGMGIMQLTIWYSLSAVFSLIFSTYLVRKLTNTIALSFDLEFWKYLFVKAWPFSLIAILSIFQSKVTTLLLSVISTDVATGNYSAAYSVINILDIPSGIIVASLFPYFSKQSEPLTLKFRKYFRNITLLSGLAAIILTVLLMLTSRLLFQFLFGESYSQAPQYFQVLLFVVIVHYINRPGVYLMNALNKQSVVFLMLLITFIIGVVLNLILIPIQGGYGASISSVISEGVFLIFTITYLRRHLLVASPTRGTCIDED